MKEVSWTAFKTYVDSSEHITIQEIVDNNIYLLWAVGGPLILSCELDKTATPAAGSDEKDYVDNYQAGANIPPPSVIDPTNKYSLQMDATSFTATKNDTTTHDFKIQNHTGESYAVKYLWGGESYFKDAVVGDWVEAQIIDKDNVLGYGANFVLKKYVLKKYVSPDTWDLCKTYAPGAIPVGTYIREIYHSTGQVDVGVYTNFEICVVD